MNPTKIEQEAFDLYTPPFVYDDSGYIFDANGEMVADDPDAFVRVRGWGRLMHMYDNVDAATIQDKIGEMIALALTEYWEKHLKSKLEK